METYSALLALCVRGIHRSFDVFLICAWKNGWVDNWDPGDLRHHRAHYDVTIMVWVSRIELTNKISDISVKIDNISALLSLCGICAISFDIANPPAAWSLSWWHNQMETVSALLAFFAGNSPVNSPHKRSVTRRFDVFFDLRLNRQFSKQWRRWWFETLPRS